MPKGLQGFQKGHKSFITITEQKKNGEKYGFKKGHLMFKGSEKGWYKKGHKHSKAILKKMIGLIIVRKNVARK